VSVFLFPGPPEEAALFSPQRDEILTFFLCAFRPFFSFFFFLFEESLFFFFIRVVISYPLPSPLNRRRGSNSTLPPFPTAREEPHKFFSFPIISSFHEKYLLFQTRIGACVSSTRHPLSPGHVKRIVTNPSLLLPFQR